MAFSFRDQVRSVEAVTASAAISHRGLFLKRTGAGQFAPCSVPGELANGIARGNASANGRVDLIYAPGGGICRAGAAIEINRPITTDGQGRGVHARPGDVVLGISRGAVAAADSEFGIDLVSTGTGDHVLMEANGAITANAFVKISAAGEVEDCDTAGEIALGVALHAAADGEQVLVAIAPSQVMVTASASITVGTELATTTAGTAAAASSNNVLGIALTAGTANNLMLVQLRNYKV